MLDALRSSLAASSTPASSSTPAAPPAPAPVEAPAAPALVLTPVRAPKRKGGEAAPSTGPEAPDEGPPAAAAATGPDLGALLDALLEGDTATLGDRLTALAAPLAVEQRRAVLAAQRDLQMVEADVSAARLEVEAAEAAFMRTGSPTDHAALEAARGTLARLSDLAELRRRAVATREGEVGAVRGRLVGELLEEGLRRFRGQDVARDLVGPFVDRLAALLPEMRAAGEAFRQAITSRRQLGYLLLSLARLAGVDVKALARSGENPYRDVVDGWGTPHGTDATDMHRRARDRVMALCQAAGLPAQLGAFLVVG